MDQSLYQCDKCGADCSNGYDWVMVLFPRGESHNLCMKCAREIFPKESEELNAEK